MAPPINNDHLPVERIFCVGRNYAEHAKELGSAVPEKPVIFMKPASCIVEPGESIHYPRNGKNLHYEAELVLQIGKTGIATSENEAALFINAFTLGLDLTLRDVQNELKDKGLPWEMSKCFEQSAPLGDFVSHDKSINLNDLTFECKVNGDIKQQGDTKEMIFNVERLLVEISKVWVFKPGDIVFTGTPQGVGPLQIRDTIEVSSELTGSFSWSIIE
ncbi:fumarylacetoacetate hydrolase family protein [Fibrobacterota bacterium]